MGGSRFSCDSLLISMDALLAWQVEEKMTQKDDQTTAGASLLEPKAAFIEHLVPRDGHHLYVREYKGAGPTMVLLHGFPDNMHIYDRVVPLLVAAGRHVVAFDFLGFGASEKPAGYAYNFEQQRGDLEAVVDFLGLEHTELVAHDASGVVAINFTLSHPDRVSALCLSNTFYVQTPTLRFPELILLCSTPHLAALAGAMLSDPKQVAFLLNFQMHELKEGAPQFQKDIAEKVLRPIITDNFFQEPSAGPAFAGLTADIRPQIERNNQRLSDLQNLSVPVKVIWGQSDVYLNTGVAEDFVTRFKQASLQLLAAGHWLMLDLPQEYADALLKDTF
jgi:haloalkane dehalogenase